MAKGKEEVCSIRIMFVVESDVQAIELKKKIAEVLADIPDVQTQFNISNMPMSPR